MTTVQAIRTFFFYLLLSSSSFFWCIFCVFIAPFLPFRARYRLVLCRASRPENGRGFYNTERLYI